MLLSGMLIPEKKYAAEYITIVDDNANDDAGMHRGKNGESAGNKWPRQSHNAVDTTHDNQVDEGYSINFYF